MNAPTTRILAYFEEINAIPRCSHNEAALGQWLQNWAAERNLECRLGKGGNLVIQVPASPGYEGAPTVVLQGHMDMVCEKTPESSHDFSTDPIVSYRDGEWLTATDTTLGADNGIAIAYMLTLADDGATAHPALELLFTVDEETGLNGAKMLSSDFLRGRVLINLDSEDEGVFTIGCAGGVDTTLILPVVRRPISSGGDFHSLVVGGLKGGHSGIDIHKHRGNANLILARTLLQIQSVTPLRLISISGGSRKNAIPRDATALIWTDAAKTREVKNAVSQIERIVKEEFASSEKSLFVNMSPAPASDSEIDSKALGPDTTDKAIQLLLSLPNGVAYMSPQLAGIVETSSNLATTSLSDDELIVLCSQRSASISRLREITDVVHAVAKLAGAIVEDHDAYPPWQPQPDSALLRRSKRVYEQLYQKAPIIQVIHAGLECAVIGDLYPGMDMISFGPTIRDPHCPDERILLPTIEKVWNFLVALLKEMQN